MNYLFVVAHPDDEVLGAGGTICKLVEEGHKVGVCILSCVCKTREDEDLIEKIKESHKMLGVHKTYFGEFECISINKAPHYEVVEYIEKAMIDFDAQVIFTHHPNDINIDHYTVSEIVGAGTGGDGT
jgi:LmbE family N-acetylglucosaminyl deacetylase